jgi:hypothetical protein
MQLELLASLHALVSLPANCLFEAESSPRPSVYKWLDSDLSARPNRGQHSFRDLDFSRDLILLSNMGSSSSLYSVQVSPH